MLQITTLPLGAYQTNCYIVWTETASTCLVIDPGYEPETVLDQCARLKKSIAAVLLTHGHFDHVGGVRTLVEKTGCPVYLCPEELSMPEEITAGPLYYTHLCREGELLKFGALTVKVLHTPGHTPGSVCFAAENALFTGDTLFQGSCGRTDLPGGSWTEIRRSLLRLKELTGCYTVYPGHGPATTLDEEKQYNPYMG